MDIKKDFQKVVKQIRDDLNRNAERKNAYPKAMMTGQQVKKRTATINCGEYADSSFVQVAGDRANKIMNDERFKRFCNIYGVKEAYVERVKREVYTTTQIRINY